MINPNQDDNGAAEIIQGTPDEVSALNLAPQMDWRGMSGSEHFVQFYEADGFLLNSLSGFIGSAINSGDGALVVATGAHREGLDELLQANGLDLTVQSPVVSMFLWMPRKRSRSLWWTARPSQSASRKLLEM